MFLIHNDIIAQIFCIQTHTKAFPYITAYGENFLQRILIVLSCTKYNEMNKGHSYTSSHKIKFKQKAYFIYKFTQKISDTL